MAATAQAMIHVDFPETEPRAPVRGRTLLFAAVLLFAAIVSTGAFVSSARAEGSEPATSARDIEFERSIDLFEAGRYEESQEVLEKLVRARPRSALYWFNLGNAQLLQGKHRQATLSYERVDRLGGPLVPLAKLYRARAHAERGRSSRALELLAEIGEGDATEMEPELMSWRAQELDRLSRGLAPGRIVAGPSVSSVSGSSVSDASSRLPGFLRGWSAAVELDAFVAADPGYQLALGAGRCLLCDSATHQLRLETGLAWWDAFEPEVSGTTRADLRLGYARSGRLEGGAGWAVLAEPFVEYRGEESRATAGALGARVGFQRELSREVRLGAEAAHETVVPVSERFGYLEENVTQARIYASSLVGASELRVGALARHELIGQSEEAGLLPLSNIGLGPEAQISMRINARWSLDAVAAMAWMVFTPANTPREDFQARGTARLTYGLDALRSGLAVVLGVTALVNRSNRGPEDAYGGFDPTYSSLTGLTGLSWQIL